MTEKQEKEPVALSRRLALFFSNRMCRRRNQLSSRVRSPAESELLSLSPESTTELKLTVQPVFDPVALNYFLARR
jgi:hypothetical protein